LDKHQFTHVLLNLFRNAKESIDQRREKEECDFEGEITVSSEEYGKEISFSVTDNGLGLEEGVEEKIFEVFYTTKPKGTGLGLGIVRRIVEDHHGSIVASSCKDGGAAFKVTLPRVLFLEFGEESVGEAEKSE
jgi:signal transduction histidine kinase